MDESFNGEHINYDEIINNNNNNNNDSNTGDYNNINSNVGQSNDFDENNFRPNEDLNTQQEIKIHTQFHNDQSNGITTNVSNNVTLIRHKF